MSHLDPGLMHELLDGEIPSMELAPIQEHLRTCAECRARLEHERQLLTDVDGLVAAIELPVANKLRMPRTTHRSRWRPGLAWAATVLLAAGLGYIARGADLRPAARQQPAPAPAKSAAAADKPAPQENSSGLANASRQRGHPLTPGEATALRQRKPDSGVIGIGASRHESPDQLAASSVAGDSAPNQAAASAAAAAPSAAGRTDDRPMPAAKSAGTPAASPEPAPGAPAPLIQSIRNLDNAHALVPRDALMARRAADTVGRAEPISLPEALARLGGTIRLIDAMVPLRLEWREPYVRVVYPAIQGELVLQQQLIDGRVVFQLIPPRGFPADSLVRLRARVKE